MAKKRKKISSSRHTSLLVNEHLPPDLWTEILLRLPAKALMKFRAVCKSWCSLIDSSDFNALRFQLYNNNNKNHPLFLVTEVYSRLGYDFTVRRNDTFRKTTTLAQLRSKFYSPEGSCNGLVLLKSYPGFGLHKIRLWNPFIRKSLILPPCPVVSATEPYTTYKTCYVLGYAPSSHDYKILAARFHSGLNTTLIAVYSLYGDQLWRIKPNVDVMDFHSRFCSLGYGRGTIFCGGVIYWIGFARWEKGTSLLSFDFDVEQFSTYQLPHSVKDTAVIVKFLFPLDDLLAVFTLSSESSCIWVLQKHDGDDPWQIWFSGESNSDACKLLTPCNYPCSRVFFIQKRMTFIIETREGLKSYNIITHQIQSLGKSLRRKEFFLSTYMETVALSKGWKGKTLTAFP